MIRLAGHRPTLQPAASPAVEVRKPDPKSVEGQQHPVDHLATSDVDSKEFKMLLDPKKFGNVKNASRKLWNKVEDAADEVGVKVKRSKDDQLRTQDIIFLDTPDQQLNKQGYILRYRDIEGGSADDNLTLKYRSQDPEKVAAIQVDAAEGIKAKPKFELDETFHGPETSVYSKSTKVKVPHLPKTTVANMTDYFPALGELGLSPDAKLADMHKGGITEERYLLGNVKIGESETAPAYLTLWYDDDHGKTPAIAEFSFAHAAHDEKTGIDQNSEELMRNLHDNAPQWLTTDGSTKTAFAYDS